MKTKSLGTIRGEGFPSQVMLDYEADKKGKPIIGSERVYFKADGDIDFDGAGSDGGRPAYTADDRGLELLANGGMGIRNGRPVFVTGWGHDIVLMHDGHPLVMPSGLIPSKTAYRYPDQLANDPGAYVDADKVPYAVTFPMVTTATAGPVLGCRCRVTYLPSGVVAEGVVADSGPRDKDGEISMAMAKALGLKNADSKRGGVGIDGPVLLYEFWPGVPAVVAGHTFRLQRANGSYV